MRARAFSSAGLEHLPYKQRVGGSNPSTPTKLFIKPWSDSKIHNYRAFSSAGLEHLPYKQRVGGSNPSTPTKIKTRYPSDSEFFLSQIRWTIIIIVIICVIIFVIRGILYLCIR